MLLGTEFIILPRQQHIDLIQNVFALLKKDDEIVVRGNPLIIKLLDLLIEQKPFITEGTSGLGVTTTEGTSGI